MHAFAEGGYAGTTTDQIAIHAGVSQPYVVRRFGSKQALFLAAYDRSVDELIGTFGRVHAAGGGREEMGHAYAELVGNREILLVMLHGFAAGADPQVGPRVRERFLEVVRMLSETVSHDPAEIRDFLANGMLINTMMALKIPEHLGEDPLYRSLAECTFGDKLAILTPEDPDAESVTDTDDQVSS